MHNVRFKAVFASFLRLRRFPLETGISVVFASFLIFVIHSDDFEEWMPRTALALVVTFFLAIATSLFRESRKSETRGSDTLRTVLFSAFPIAYGIGFSFASAYLGTESPEGMALFLLHLTGFFATLLVSPYIGNTALETAKAKWGESGVGYSNYLGGVAWTILMSAIVGGAVSALGFVAIGSVVTLFDLDTVFHDTGKLFATWAAISLGLVAPFYGLIHFPELSGIRRDDYETNRFFSFLVRFVGIPAIFVYFAILYAYSIRVLANFQDWPKGVVSWMVVGFSSFGYLAYAFSKPHENDGKYVAAFRKSFPFAVLPQMLMLFYAIFLRIGQYDLTTNRYFVVVFGVWLTAVSLYFVASKKKSLVVLPASLACFSIAVSFGPWSVFSLPLERQYDRLVRHMEEAKLLKDGIPVRLTASIDAKLENSIVSEIEYVCEYRRCAKLRPMFEKTLEDAQKAETAKWKGAGQAPSLSSWEAANAIKTALNVRSISEADGNPQFVQLSAGEEPYPLAITGYDFIVSISQEGSVPVFKGAEGGPVVPYPFVQIDPASETMLIVDAAGSETLPISDFSAKIRSKYGNVPSYGTADPKDLSFAVSSAKYEAKVFLRAFNYKNEKYSGTADGEDRIRRFPDWYKVSGVALLKRKGR